MRACALTTMSTTLLLTMALFAQESTTVDTSCDLARGETQFVMCSICHTNEAGAGPGPLGPNLYGVIGQPVAAQEDFFYTTAMTEYGDTWTIELLDRFLKSPLSEAPGTTMAFAGIANDDDRAALLCYLEESGPTN